jgi:NTE family protein
MLQALTEHQIEPDLIVGTSVGAINAAWIAGRPGLAGASELAALWRSVRRRDVFPVNPLAGFEGFIGRTDYLVPPNHLRRLLAKYITYERLEQAPISIRVVTTDVTTGLEVVLDRGPAVDAVMASAAIPAIFPPVLIEGRYLVDGGVADNTPISHAVDAGASVIYVLPTGYACALHQPPRGALAMALQALTLLVHERLHHDVERYREGIDLRVVPPLCPLNVSPIDFSHTAELIHAAHDQTARWLDNGQPQEDAAAPLAFHEHPAASRATSRSR